MLQAEADRRFLERHPERRRKQKREAQRRYMQKHSSEQRSHKELYYKYKLTPEGYDELWRQQGEVCGACGATEPRGGRWVIDHCHETRTIRGILCNGCNVAIGQVGESIDALLDLANYLKTRSAA